MPTSSQQDKHGDDELWPAVLFQNGVTSMVMEFKSHLLNDMIIIISSMI